MNRLTGVSSVEPIKIPPYIDFIYTITGTSYTSTTLPTTLNSGGKTDTFLTITNFNSTKVNSKNITIYVKGIFNTSSNTQRILTFANNINSTSDTSNFLNIALQNSSNAINFAYRANGSTIIDTASSNNIFTFGSIVHYFIVFNATTSIVSFYAYDNSNTLIYSIVPTSSNYTPSNAMSSFNNFCLGRKYFTGSTDVGSNVSIYTARWYTSALSTSNMQSVVGSNA
jgi:hypothetical protein